MPYRYNFENAIGRKKDSLILVSVIGSYMVAWYPYQDHTCFFCFIIGYYCLIKYGQFEITFHTCMKSERLQPGHI